MRVSKGGPIDPNDERLVHRLEAFSDIVIGFCVAQLAFSLVIPKTIAELKSHLPLGLTVFGITFIVIVLIWWYHNRLFAKFFVPSTLSVSLNFCLLGVLVLLIYFLETYRTLVGKPGWELTFQLWMVAFAVVYVLLGVMYAMGIVQRRAFLEPDDLQWGVTRATSLLLEAIAFVALAIYFPHAGSTALVYTAIGLVLFSAINAGFISPRIARAYIAR